ncbi:MAG: LysM domain-containing protein [Acidimicrobiia bacterium]
MAPAGPRRRTAIHDPWSPRRRIGLPSGMPPPPVVLGGVMALLFAFLLGRCTAGGGNEVSTGTGTSSAAATTTTLFETTHVVEENETLAAIADQYGITINELAVANGIGDANRIFVGQVLKIPPKTPVTTTSTTLKKNKKKNN